MQVLRAGPGLRGREMISAAVPVHADVRRMGGICESSATAFTSAYASAHHGVRVLVYLLVTLMLWWGVGVVGCVGGVRGRAARLQ